MRFLVAGLLGIAAACVAIEVPRATHLDVQRAALHRPATTLADLDHGRSLYLSRCGGCHQPVDPRGIQTGDWPGHVAEMRKRARLGEDEADLVVLYLVTMSSH